VGNFTSLMTGLTPLTTYYVRAYAVNTIGTAYGLEMSFVTTSTAALATLTTTAMSSITTASAASGGTIASDGGAPVTARGVVWSTGVNPTIANSKTIDGAGIGSFSSTLTSLSANTMYHVRAYATNSTGTNYGQEEMFTTPALVAYAIGDIGPGGGYVFYVSSDGHGMEITSAAEEFETQWGCYSTDIPGTFSASGTGQANSNIILAYHNSINFYANPAQCQEFVTPVGVITSTGDVDAKECDDLVYNGFSDWYLPSIGDLQLVYTNLKLAGLGDFNTSFLTTSTQTSSNYRKADALDFTTGLTSWVWKHDLAAYRAVRNF
jgi:hypothetical protein